ncbi:hypothetical protein LX32DRAFT_642542 [Colletotrichum zoysiae]|uniref:Uncharacterized protein n=1 Tax=Colletotrichum zoysiae TaxID=1216348 RepID=A0AAD9LYL6_9PEZI|nr:hypothetical protein LX32DRAFT_642542 [Colletotrichum zoysiae]
MEPYFRPDDADSACAIAPGCNPVSQESLMYPPVTTIAVRIAFIDLWEELGVDLHRDHTDINTRKDPRRPLAQDFQTETVSGGKFLAIHE